MRTTRFLLGALALLLPATVAAQTNAPASVVVPQVHDTGLVQNTGSARGPVLSFTVQIEGARWMRLKFSDVTLSGSAAGGNASVLRITSWEDGAQQEMLAQHVTEWGNTTAYFNGSTVQVDVLSSPGSGASRVRLESVTAGLDPNPSRSQCGATDDRQLSSDNRACRILPIGCTAWVINDSQSCMLTAGHCSGSVSVAQFNVPLSSAGGSIRNPPPQDQYAVDGSSMQSNGGGGIGNDYAYFGVFPNSSTGLTPFQTYNVRYTLVAPPSFSSGQQIRVTGYGVDSGNRNQVQQTHVGPRVNASGTRLSYQVDTQGGNSGSPVIFEATGEAIGIHTHAGCSSTSGNNGTASNHFGLQAFFANPQGVCANGPPPVAQFSGAPTSGVAPLVVAFAEQAIGGPATGWSWNFGDGGTSTLRNPSHTYATGGKYNVSLTVVGPGGSHTETKNKYIDVTAVPTIFSVTPSTIPALIPGTARTITIDGEGFSGSTTIEIDGVPIPTTFRLENLRTLTFDMPELSSLGAHTVGIVDPMGSDTSPVTVVAPSSPVLQLGNGDLTQNTLFTFLGLPVVAAGQPGELHLLVFSSSNTPSVLAGFANLCLGNAFQEVVISNLYVIGANGLATDNIPLGPSLIGATIYGQTLNIDLPISTGYPLEESNCQNFSVFL